jgi:hypothetical protein
MDPVLRGNVVTVGLKRCFVSREEGLAPLDSFDRIRWIDPAFQIETTPITVVRR